MKNQKLKSPSIKRGTSVRLPDGRAEQLDVVAAQMGGGVNRSDVIRIAVELYLDDGPGKAILAIARKKSLRASPRVVGAA